MLQRVIPWPPDYISIFAWRQEQLLKLRKDPVLLAGAKLYYKDHPIEFIEHWIDTYDPRNAGTDRPTHMPFKLFKRQREAVEFIYACLKEGGSGLIEKSKDMGVTWICCAISIHLFLFWDGASIGWGSRKSALVDTIGNPDSIFEKIRMGIRRLPNIWYPPGFSLRDHMGLMKIINPANDATITGEGGDDIGRGGRSLAYFKDEAQPLYAKILTPEGWQTMADMEVGSRVIGIDGKPRKVTHVKDCGVEDVYRFTMSDGTTAECSPNHLWLVEQKARNDKRRVVLRAHEIAANLCYVCKGGKFYKYRVPTCAPIEFGVEKELPLHPYVVGALLGDGCTTRAFGGAGFTSADPQIPEEISKLLPPGVIITKRKGNYSYGIVAERGRWGRALSPARVVIEQTGIKGCYSWEKFIPDPYKFGSVAQRVALLQGLMDTDGSSAGGVNISFHTSSPRLARDVRFLVESLGGSATLRVVPPIRKPTYHADHILRLCMPKQFVPFRLKRKIESQYKRKHPPGRTIVAVEVIARVPVRCITVDAEDGTYLTDSCLVTHNSAHYEHPELIEAALSDNALVQIDFSSVCGLGTVFHRKREAGVDWAPGQPIVRDRVNVLVMDWRDHPAKTQDWYNNRKAKAESEGIEHVFAQEVDRNYGAAVVGTIVKQDWFRSAIDAHIHLGFSDDGAHCAALDIADTGGDTNALAIRKGVVLRSVEEWGERDTGVTARRAITACKPFGTRLRPIHIQYDFGGGWGAAFKAEHNRLVDEDTMPKTVRPVPWNGGGAVLYPEKNIIPRDKDSPLNEDFYANLKAQGWWELRRRFEITHRARTEPDFTWDVEDLISIDSNIPLIRKLEKEICQPTMGQSSKLKLLVNKKPDGMKSPNLADSVMMCYWPVPVKGPMNITDELLKRI